MEVKNDIPKSNQHIDLPHHKKRRKTLFIFALIIITIIIIFIIGAIFTISKNKTILTENTNSSTSSISEVNYSKYTSSGLNSRAWIEYAMDIIRQKKPAPTESSRFYAYVTTMYSIGVDNKFNDRIKNEAVALVVNQIFPDMKDTTNKFVDFLVPFDSSKYGNGTIIDGVQYTVMDDKTNKLITDYLNREKNDGKNTLIWDGKIPAGDGKWKQVSIPPFTPRAGEWQRWIIDPNKEYNVPQPFLPGTSEYEREKQLVKNAEASRTASDIAEINFWGGTPGTEQPGGIWQNVMYGEVKDKKLSDDDYSKSQKILAQSIADSFMECWKIKYKYWTERPSTTITDLRLAMNNPNFPGYVSGHSTISRTAAEVLGVIFPDKKDRFIQDATNAKNSRLSAGVHFDMDNKEGFILGEKIGKDINIKLGLAQPTPGQIISNGQLKDNIQDQSDQNKDTAIKTKSYLYLANLKGDYDHRFVFVSSDNNPTINPNWDIYNKGYDAYWNPGACSSYPTIAFNNRYITTLEYSGLPGGDISNGYERVITYDTVTKKFNYIFDNKDHSQEIVGGLYISKDTPYSFYYFYLPKGSSTNTNIYHHPTTNYIIKREIQLPSLIYTDYKIPFPNNFINNDSTLIIDSKNNIVVFSEQSSNAAGKYAVFNNNSFGDVKSSNEVYNVLTKDLNVFNYKIDDPKSPNLSTDQSIFTDSNPRSINIEDNKGFVINTTQLKYTQYLDFSKNIDNKLYLNVRYNTPIQGGGKFSSNIGFLDIQNKKLDLAIINTDKIAGDSDFKYYVPGFSTFVIGVM